MADSKEQFQNLLNNMRANANRLFLFGLALLLVIRIFILMSESTMGVGDRVERQPINLTPKLDPSSDNYKKVEAMIKQWPAFEESSFRALATNNMFDPRRALDAAEIEKRAREKYSDALVMFRQNNLQSALSLVDESLELNPRYQRAKELREQIQKALEPAQDQTGEGTTGEGQAPTGQ